MHDATDQTAATKPLPITGSPQSIAAAKERREAAEAKALRISEIEQWLRLVHPGDDAIMELRAPQIPDGTYKVTASGLYDFDHIRQMAESAYDLTTNGMKRGKQSTSPAPGVYFTINPVSKETHARHYNVTEVAKKEQTTSDEEIIRRRLMLIDIDPVRVSGVSSTDEEKQHAREVADNVNDYLSLEGWPSPIVVDSANGWHLYYRIDLPADDGEIVQNVIEMLASQFNSPYATVDTSVFNPSRISKIPGTMGRKGHDTPNRPHRFAKVISSPVTWEVVPRAFLEQIANEWKEIQKKKDAERKAATKAASDLRQWSGPRPKSQQRVEDRARAYIANISGAIEGQHGSDATFRVAGILINDFDLSVDAAFPLISEWNLQCDPPWDDHDLMRKLTEAEKKGGEKGRLLTDAKQNDAMVHQQAGDAGGLSTSTTDTWADGIPDNAVVNGIPGTKLDKKGNEVECIDPIGIENIVARIKRAASGKLYQSGGILFNHETNTDGPVLKFPDEVHLFSWLGSVGTKMPPRFYNLPGSHSRKDGFTHVIRSVKEYRTIEYTPHEPPIPDCYYACEMIQPGDGTTLKKLLSMINTETETDRQLLLAYIATVVWGGECGARPVFFFTSTEGRGAGKTTVADMLASIAGPMISFSNGESSEMISKRLLSPEGELSRVAIIDNLKSHRFSWAAFEALVTSRSISGHRLYHGESTRPNRYTWVVTTNGISLSTDIAQRAVVIRIKRPVYSGDWIEDTWKFIRTNRKAIIADVIAFLRGPQSPLTKTTRWALWERDIISRLQNPDAAQSMIAARQLDADAEDEESQLLVDHLKMKINDELLYAKSERVFVPSPLMARWYCEATGERNITKTTVSRIVKQQIGEGKLPQLKINTTCQWGRGYIWQLEAIENNPAAVEPVQLDIEHQIEKMEISERAERMKEYRDSRF